jgi:hypothetical protein
MNLTGKDVHKAMVTAFPYLAPHWEALPNSSKDGYDQIADELNKLINERNAHAEEANPPNEEKR